MAAIEVKVPSNLDFEELEKQFPFTNLPNTGGSAEYLYYICGILVKQGFKNAIFEKKSRPYISLCTEYLRKVHFNYEFFMDYLLRAGVIETDGFYTPESKCLGYRFKKMYQECLNLKTIRITEYKLSKKIRRWEQTKREKRIEKMRPYMHLIKWFNKNLQIDKVGASKWLNEYFEIEMDKIERAEIEQEVRETKRRNLFDKCRGMAILIDRIEAGEYDIMDFNNCKFGRRLHSIFTYLKKDIRHFITYNGQKLVGVDVKNCQPYLLIALMNAEFWKSKKNRNNKVQLWEVCAWIYKKIRENRSKYNSIMLLVSPQTLVQQRVGISRYKNLTVDGRFYETLLEELPLRLSQAYHENYGYRVANRDGMKKEVLRTMYCSNHAYSSTSHETSRIINEMFPDFISLLKAIKDRDFKLLPQIIQRLESKLILKIICERITEERPDLYISTIHDSIVTTVGNEEYVKSIIEEVLTEKIGLPPKLDFQYWSPELATFEEDDIEEWLNELIEEEENNYICDNQI